MENNRPKIASLSDKELAMLLKESYFKVGRQLKLDEGETKLFMDEVYKNQGWMYVDIFSEAFSRLAACELADAENLRPYVSPMFISKLMKIYFKRGSAGKCMAPRTGENFTALTPENKYTLFIKFILCNRRIPANPDWIAIYEHLVKINKLELNEEWETLSYLKKMKYGMNAVTEWVYKSYKL